MKQDIKKIYLLTSEDPLYSIEIVKSLYENFGDGIVGAAYSDGLFHPKRIYLGPLLYGPLNFVKIVFIVVSSIFTGGKIENYLASKRIKIDRVKTVNEDALYERIQKLNVNLLISINCNNKINERLFSFPKFKTINIHNGKLPSYGGLMPIFHAYANNETDIGVTIHYVDKNLDSGEIIRQDTIPILESDTYFSLWKKCVDQGAVALVEVVEQIYSGKAATRPNDKTKRSYYSFPKFKTILNYYRRYLKLN